MSYEKPTRKGYRLKYDYECEYNNWLDLGGCTCPFSSPPCSSCTHEGHPIALEEDDEAWELDIEEEEMSRDDIVKKDDKIREGDFVEVVNECRLREMSDYCTLTLGKSYRVESLSSTAETLRIIDDKGKTVNWGFYRFKKVDKPTQPKVPDLPLFFPDKDLGLTKNTTEIKIVKGREKLAGDSMFKYDDIVDALRSYCKNDIELTNKLFNKQEETNMTQIKRRVLNIQLLDNDAGLPVEHALVAEFDGVVTEDTDEVTIQELISNGEVAEKIKTHNKVRIEQINLEIQNRTGNTVKLLPIKLKNLTWNIK